MIHQFYFWAKGGQKYNWEKYMHHYVNHSSIPNTQEREIKCKFNMHREDVAHIYYGIYKYRLVGFREKWMNIN